jgi:hypothetical protein
MKMNRRHELTLRKCALLGICVAGSSAIAQSGDRLAVGRLPTVGVQGITARVAVSVDEYLDWAVPSYAKLYYLTKDRHYLDVARGLLHDTKAMAAGPAVLVQ